MGQVGMSLPWALRPALAGLAAVLLSAAPPDLLVDAALAQIGVTTQYDGRYIRLPYPGGDVPMDRGVCTDVLIRAYRSLGLDLQRLVHEDMTASWEAYPNPWKMKSPDRNIDHRRVPNLAAFLKRHGTVLAPSRESASYRPGDIVTWELPRGLPHIGIVSRTLSPKGVPLMIHNIGQGVKRDDLLFTFPITGHYRYFGAAPVSPGVARPSEESPSR